MTLAGHNVCGVRQVLVGTEWICGNVTAFLCFVFCRQLVAQAISAATKKTITRIPVSNLKRPIFEIFAWSPLPVQNVLLKRRVTGRGVLDCMLYPQYAFR